MSKRLMAQINQLKEENERLSMLVISQRQQVAVVMEANNELKTKNKELIEENISLLERMRKILKEEVKA